MLASPLITTLPGWRRVTLRLCLVLACLSSIACAGYEGRTREARSALDAGNPRRALELYNEELEVDSEADVPQKEGGDNALLLLERAMILQQLDQYKLSSRDMQLADKQIEMLDFSRNTLDDIGKYVFSDDAGPYKAPPYEKLMINTMNMVNYLARGDLNGARIEARRLTVMQKYLKDSESPAASLLGPGSYLAGFTFEKSERPQEALRYYDEALAYGSYSTLTEPVRRLATKANYRTPRLRKLIGEDGNDAAPTSADGKAELLVIVSFGRVPNKIAKRIPIGLALTYASGALSPHDRSRANELAAQGLVTWVNYPTLGKARGSYGRPGFWVNNRPEALEGIIAVDREARRAFEQARGAIVASAITRMISRVIAGQATKKAAGDGAVGVLLSLGAQATLTAVDTPDTRSWETLPARMAFGRLRLSPGTYSVSLEAQGSRKKQKVALKSDGFAVVALTVLE